MWFKLKDKNVSNQRRNKNISNKEELKSEENKIVKLQTYDLSLFIGQSYFNNDGS